MEDPGRRPWCLRRTPLPGYAPRVPAALDLDDVTLTRGGRQIIGNISLRVEREHRWLLLGANGSGKTSLVRIAALYEHPSSGTVRVLGEQLGRTDVRTLRRRIGYASAAFAVQLRSELRAADVVKTARFAALETWWHDYDDADEQRARACLDRLGVARLADRSFGTLSSGEQQRVLLARTLMNEPAVVLLDEPSARLDLAGREQLVGSLAELATDPSAPPLVLVTHHVDDVPVGMTHVLLLRDGRALDQGPVDDVLTADALSECFGIPLVLERRADGRITAWARR
jgi:iron complex transport system ATP-binding protein